LGSLTIGSSVTSIGNSAFRKNQLTSVTIPNSVVSIGNYAFAENRLSAVALSAGLVSVGNYAFANNQLNRVNIGANVEIEDYSFPGDFADFYDAQRRRAGTYTFINGKWNIGR